MNELVNRSYEGEVKGMGSVVSIPKYQAFGIENLAEQQCDAYAQAMREKLGRAPMPENRGQAA